MYPYIETTKVYLCATAPEFLNRNVADLKGCTDTNVKFLYNYAFNTYLGDNPGGASGNVGGQSQIHVHYAKTLNGVPQPSATLRFAEQNTFDDAIHYRIPLDDPDFRTSTGPPGIPLDGIGSDHSGKAHVAFVDGHVELRPPEDSQELAFSETELKKY